ncbi:ArsR/SmtB family transcription factor [Bacillus salitolerans]|uniref:ArsR/SmtB family transcription factor n=1 Tax=Bacillus salitolerans TaxID=1437434 RepID=A0ABW4LXL7_9BACI
MKTINEPVSQETVTITVDFSPVWEIIVGIAGYTYQTLRHTFEFDEKWKENQSSMSTKLLNNLSEIEKTNLWYGLLLMQNKLSARSIQEFIHALHSLAPEDFYETLLPYKNRSHEEFRKEAAKNVDRIIQYSSLFEEHDYLEGYIVTLSEKKQHEIVQLFSEIMTEWYEWIYTIVDWEKWMKVLSLEKSKHHTIDSTNPIEEVKRVTEGAKYTMEPSIWNIKLIPHVSYRPWILEQRTSDTKLFYYPINDEAFQEPGIPPKGLIRGHKALGDELRLKLLFQIIKGPLSLQDLSAKFNVSKTALHHQLSLLKAAKFISVHKGIYSANPTQIQSFTSLLGQYLGTNYENVKE